MIHTRQLTKKFSNRTVLNGVDLDIAQGGIHGLVGRNGVGKSTLLSLIAGQLKPTSGELTVFGEKPFDRASVMDRVALTGVDVTYPSRWRMRDILTAASLRYPGWDEVGAEQLITDFALEDSLHTGYGTLSRGQRAMVGIIVGLASSAELTLLDEPYVGLDTHNRDVFYRHLLAMRDSHRTFVVATHHIHESSKVLDSVIILGRDGTVKYQYTADELSDSYVLATGVVPEAPGVLARQESHGTERALVPRGLIENLGPGVRTETADMSRVIEALLEES
ncbi:ABC transporter ATP-binding protein [Corynebacterium breve]|uniref:ABC transporter ATP-binding protein n=1 Tax=Corynebacterium breve TaxID=3049799 RepID=A0ABY8VDN3_9CORY|nr:ABC transporter ATP-binding protein [Corynebacterium breve]WIM67574.1 ABC transporter ATP-binding protein [Corynebacterium breve]